jgi:tetratricopeptide (TPR) repeat protein
MLPRATLLALSMLTACAAGGPNEAVSGAASRPIVGASGAFLVGRFALGEMDLNPAVDDLLKALAADPKNVELQQQAFGAAVLAGRPEALTLARALPSNPAAMLVLADQDVLANNWPAAEAKFTALPGQGLTQVLQPLLLAWSQQGAGQTDEAMATLQPYLNGTRYRGVFALHAAMINDLAGRQTDAAQYFRTALAEYGALNLRLGTLVASWQARNGHEAEARATIRAMVASSPDLSIAEPALQMGAGQPQINRASDGIAEAYLALAATLQQQDAADFALLLLRQALDLRPNYTSARLLASDVETSRGQLAMAAATLAPVPASDPLIAVVRLRQARIDERLGKLDEAQTMLEQLASDYPDRPEPLAQLAEMQRGNGHFSEAAITYGRALDRVKQPVRSDWALFYEQGMAYDRAHDWPHAEADFLRALDLSPDQPYVLNYLGYAWTEQGRNLPRARAMIERAVAERPNDGAIADSLGWVMLRQGDRADAVRWLEHAVELQPEDSTVNGHLGDAYWAIGRRTEAQTQWRRALVLNPAPEEAAQLNAKLAGAVPPPPAVAANRRVE